jgi:type I restriction enzyme M protein
MRGSHRPTVTRTWSEENPDGRCGDPEYDDLLKRDKLSLDLFWIEDKGLTDVDSLPGSDRM